MRERNKMSVNERKSIEIDETDCDNPISLDEIEKGIWLGLYILYDDNDDDDDNDKNKKIN